MDKPKRAQTGGRDAFESAKAMVEEAIWSETPPVRFLGAVRGLLQVYLHRQFFNDAFARYKKTRGRKVCGPGCVVYLILD